MYDHRVMESIIRRVPVLVDANLVRTAKKFSGLRANTEAVEHALHKFIQAHRRTEAIRHAGAYRLTLDRAALRRLRRRS